MDRRAQHKMVVPYEASENDGKQSTPSFGGPAWAALPGDGIDS